MALQRAGTTEAAEHAYTHIGTAMDGCVVFP